jgi:hypothetical protein
MVYSSTPPFPDLLLRKPKLGFNQVIEMASSALSGSHKNFYADYVIQYSYANTGEDNAVWTAQADIDSIRTDKGV